MNKTRIMSSITLPLFALTLLTTSLIGVSAVPTSPYIMVVPEETWDSTITIGSTYAVSIYTDYTGSDVWSWQFSLTFNPSVLEGATVTNGDLITTIKDPSAVFVPGTFDNALGRLSLTVAYFDYATPPAPQTSGPGYLGYVEFTVIGYGFSDVELVEEETILLDPSWPYIIDGDMDPDHIGHGSFRNTIPGDIQGDVAGSIPDGDVDYYDFLAFAAAYLKTSGQPAYNPMADLQGDTAGSPPDGDVDYYDFLLFAANYLKTIPLP